MREDKRKDNYKLEGSIRIAQGECEKCSKKGTNKCGGYECEKWNNGWAVEKISCGGIDVVRTRVSFCGIGEVYLDVLEEIRKETHIRLRGKHKK